MGRVDLVENRFIGMKSRGEMYRVFRYLRIPPPLLHNLSVQWYIWKLYVSRTLYQFQIMFFRTIVQLTYFWSYGLCIKVEHIFMNNFCLYFWGGFPKIIIKLSIIGLNSYTIPHLKANMSCMYHDNIYFISMCYVNINWMGQRSQIEKVIFLIIVWYLNHRYIHIAHAYEINIVVIQMHARTY